MHKERLHIWGDYQLVYEHKKEWKKGNDKNQIHNLKILGDKLKETKNELKTQQAEIKNRWIQRITDEIRENIKHNRSRLVWRRLNQLKENNGTSKQKDLGLKNQEGELKSTVQQILDITHKHMKKNTIKHLKTHNTRQLTPNYGMTHSGMRKLKYTQI